MDYCRRAQQGNDDEESKTKYEELKNTWNRIMSGTQEKLQSDLDIILR